MLIRGQAAGNKPSGKDGAVAKPQARVKSLLSLYAEAPTGEIRLEEFERFSIDRLMGACAAGSLAVLTQKRSSSVFVVGQAHRRCVLCVRAVRPVLLIPLVFQSRSFERDRGPQGQGHKPSDGDRENPRGRTQTSHRRR